MSETFADHRQVGFIESVQLYLGNYFQFQGRSSRGAFWWACVALILFGVVTGTLDAIIFPGMAFGPIGGVGGLLTFIPSLALAARRLHDTGRSGWWLLLLLIPVIGLIVLIVFYAQPGKREDLGKYGADVEAGK